MFHLGRGVKIVTAQVVPFRSPVDDGKRAVAVQRANTIRGALKDLHNALSRYVPALQEAWDQEDWRVLGYGSWQAYCDAELAVGRLKLTRDERQWMVAELRQSDMSERAIAAVLGVSQMTVHRDATSAEPKDSPVKGVDGKTYPARKPKVIKPDGEPVSGEEETEEQTQARLSAEESRQLTALIDRKLKDFRSMLTAVPPEVSRSVIEILISGLEGEPAGTIVLKRSMKDSGKTIDLLSTRADRYIACMVRIAEDDSIHLRLFT